MKNNKMKTISILGIALVMVFTVSSCNKKSNAEENSTAGKSELSEKTFPVKTQKVNLQTIARTLEYSADLQANEEIHYAPAAPGRIDKILVEIGSKVSKGQVLATMDRTQLNQALSQLENAKFNFNSVDTLYGLGSISKQQYEQAKTQYELAKSNVDYLSQNTTLTSPINGMVTGKYYEDGELYSGAPNTTAGKAAIVTLMQIDPLKAIVNVSQSSYPKMQKGMTANITTSIYPDMVFEGTVAKIHPTIDPATRTFQVEIVVANKEQNLRPGMFANIDLKLRDKEALLVPAISVLKQEGTNNRYVFVYDNGTAKQIMVSIGKRLDDLIELKANGIQKGSELIVEGQANLLNGSKVKIASN